jgi:hypothetical protein
VSLSVTTVVFFGHGPVEAPQAALEVPDRNPHLVGRHGSRERAVDIPHHEHEIRPLLREHLLEPDHDLRDLPRRASGRHAEATVGADAELLEEHIGHVGTEVLAGVDDPDIQSSAFGSDRLQSCDLDDVRASADDNDNFFLHLWPGVERPFTGGHQAKPTKKPRLGPRRPPTIWRPNHRRFPHRWRGIGG